MTFVSASQFHVYLPWVQCCLAQCLNSVLNLKALVGAFNQEKALIGAFSVITNLRMELFQTLLRTKHSGPLLTITIATIYLISTNQHFSVCTNINNKHNDLCFYCFQLRFRWVAILASQTTNSEWYKIMEIQKRKNISTFRKISHKKIIHYLDNLLKINISLLEDTYSE